VLLLQRDSGAQGGHGPTITRTVASAPNLQRPSSSAAQPSGCWRRVASGFWPGSKSNELKDKNCLLKDLNNFLLQATNI
jgi:hypothetical protein